MACALGPKKFSDALVVSRMRTARKPREGSASGREGECLLQPIVAPKDFRTDREGRCAENAELAGAIRRRLQQTFALRALGAGDDRRWCSIERGKNALDVIADARRAPGDEPVMKCRARVVVA